MTNTLAVPSDIVIIQSPEEIKQAAMSQWKGLAGVPPAQLENFIAICQTYSLNPILGEVTLLTHRDKSSGSEQYSVYPTAKGLMKILASKGVLDGISAGRPTWNSEIGAWEVEATIWIKGSSHPYTGFGYASSRDSKINQLWDHAATRAKNRVIRDIVAIPIPSAEEMQGEGWHYVGEEPAPAAALNPPAQVDSEASSEPKAADNGQVQSSSKAAPYHPPPAASPPPSAAQPQYDEDVADEVRDGEGVYMLTKVLIKETKVKELYAVLTLQSRSDRIDVSAFREWEPMLTGFGLKPPFRLKATFDLNIKVRVELVRKGQYLNIGWLEHELDAPPKPQPPGQAEADELQPPLDPEPAPKKGKAEQLSTETYAYLLYEARRVLGAKDWEATAKVLETTIMRTFRKLGIASNDPRSLPHNLAEDWIKAYGEKPTHTSIDPVLTRQALPFSMRDAIEWVTGKWDPEIGDLGDAIDMDNPLGSMSPGD